MSSLAQSVVRSASTHGDRRAIILDDATLTWSELHGLAARVAGALRAAGLAPGDRVALILPNVPAYPVLFYGTLLAGGVVVPLNPLLKEAELEYFFSDSGASFAFVWQDFAPAAQAAGAATGTTVIVSGPVGPAADALPAGEPIATPEDVAGDETAVILYTSGTTGKPKGAQLTHDNIRLNAQRSAEVIMEMTPDDVIMGCLPLFHVFGLTCGLIAATTSGATLTLVPRFDPEKALEVVERDRVTIFQGVPTMYAAMLHAKRADSTDTSSLRACVSGGSAMPVEVMSAFEEKFSCRIFEGYGLSETSPVASFNMPDGPTKPGTIGRTIPGCEMRLLDDSGAVVGPGEGVGEIVIRGDNVMKGYWNKPEETEAAIPDGWFRTGDLATVDDEGYYTIVDRKKDMIIRGGMNVYPREVEECLYTHPAVREVAVVSVPDELMGEEIGAAVGLKEETSTTPEELQQFVKERLAAYKYPRHVWIVDELPKGPTGKILRREVRAPQG